MNTSLHQKSNWNMFTVMVYMLVYDFIHPETPSGQLQLEPPSPENDVPWAHIMLAIAKLAHVKNLLLNIPTLRSIQPLVTYTRCAILEILRGYSTELRHLGFCPKLKQIKLSY